MLPDFTVSSNDFATAVSGNVVGLSTTGGYANVINGGTLTAAKANDIAAGSVSAGAGSGTVTISALRFNDGSGNSTLTIGSTKSVTLTSSNNETGAILVTSVVGNHQVTITGGTIKGVGSRDLAIIQNNTAGLLEIDSVIVDNGANGALTKSGLGTALLTGTNTYQSATYINEGTLIADGAATALGTGAGTAGGANVIHIASRATLQIGNNDAGSTLVTTGTAQTLTNNSSRGFQP